MNSKEYRHQSGAVLMFSLVILLLITLVGVSMIQQNRIQFMMAGNVQDQSTAFASSQDILSLGETYIEGQRYSNATTFVCNATTASKGSALPIGDQLQPGNITASLPLADKVANKVEIIDTSCMTIADVETSCTFDASNDVHCNQSDSAKCATEVYTIRSTATNTTTGSKRIVESRFAIRCDSYQ